MKDIKWYTWLGMILLFMIATVAFVKVFSTVDKTAHSETISVKVESEEIDHLIQLETETKETGSLTSVKSTPFTEMEEIDKPIKKWANKREKKFFSEMQEADILLDHQASAHFSLQSEVIPLTDELYQIVISTEQSVNQENSYASMKSFTIDLKEKKLTGLNNITKDTFSLGKLYNLIRRNSDNEIDNRKFHEQYKALDDIDWTVNKDNIVFYLKHGISSSNENKEIVSLMSFHTYIKDSYYDVFITDDLKKRIKLMEEKTKRKKEEEEQHKKAELKKNKYIALTFDDGPHPKQTVRILNTLEKYDAKATFFALGNNIKNNLKVVERIINDGHELGNHSMSHANLNAVKKKQARSEIFDSQDVSKKITGKKPTIFRPPYGNFQTETETMINESNQEIILWSVDTHDWESKNAKSIYETVKKHTVPGSIVLMHDIYPTTADALPKILKYYKKNGFETVTITELMPYIEDTNNGAYFGH